MRDPNALATISNFLAGPWQSGIGLHSMLVLLMLAPAAGLVGVWAVSYRLSYAVESLPHTLIPGMVVAASVGASLLLGASLAVIAAALTVAVVANFPKVSRDTAIAAVVTFATALGVVIAFAQVNLPPLQEILFGNLLGADTTDIYTALALSLSVVAVMTAFRRKLLLTLFDPDGARSLGTSPPAATVLLLLAVAATLVVAVQSLGTLLAAGIVLGPAMAALKMAKQLTQAFWIAAAVAALSSLVGFYISYNFNLAAGPTICLVALLVPLLVYSLYRVTR